MGIISIQKYANSLCRNSHLCPYTISVFKQLVLCKTLQIILKRLKIKIFISLLMSFSDMSGNGIFWASTRINRFNSSIKVKTNIALDSLIIKMQLSQSINCEVFLLLIVLQWLGFFTGTFCGEQGPSEVSIVREWKGGLALETVFVYGNLAFMNGWLTI